MPYKDKSKEAERQRARLRDPAYIAYQAAYREAHRDKQREYMKQYNQEHSEDPVAHRERSRAHYLANVEKRKIQTKAWWDANPGVRAFYTRNYHLKKLGAAGICSKEQLQARIEFYGGRCWMCGAPYDAIDHVVPISKGGTNWPANLRPACKPCNSRKHNRSPWEFVRVPT